MDTTCLYSNDQIKASVTAIIRPKREDGLYAVDVRWDITTTEDTKIELGRPVMGGWIVRTAKIAMRLAAAINAQKVFDKVDIFVDVNGKSFPYAAPIVNSRFMNRDLKKLGF